MRDFCGLRGNSRSDTMSHDEWQGWGADERREKTRVFELLNIRSDDDRVIDRVVGFLAENQDEHVRFRPRDELDKAIDAGLGIRIEKDGKICGCSLIYKFEEPDRQTLYSEIGTMRIVANGYDLQSFAARLHIMQIHLEEFGAGQNTIFAIVEPGTASEHNLVNKVRMAKWDPPISLRYMREGCGVPFSDAKYAIAADRAARADAFQSLKRLHAGGAVFSTPKENEQVRVNMGWFEPELLNISL